MEGFRLFAPIAKVDAQKRLVYGIAASESEDKSGERFDYESSAPEFMKWSAEIAKGSGGKSLGNVRVMHQPVVAGVLIDLKCDDAAKTISVCARVVSEEAWKMVEAGAYTGFSIGGRYAKRWSDENEPAVKRYTAIPSEISLVDNPCNPDAYFEVIKADGLTERRGFLSARAEPAAAKAGGRPSGEGAVRSRDEVVQRWLAKDGSAHPTKAAAIARNEETMKGPAADGTAGAAGDAAEMAQDPEAAGMTRGEGRQPYGNIEYADPGWQEDKKRRYPVDTERHIRAAWSYIHKPKNARRYGAGHLTEIKHRIIAAWRKKIDPNGPPQAAPAGEERSEKAVLALMLAKHLAETGEIAQLILALKALKDRLALDMEMEDADPTADDGPDAVADEATGRQTANPQALTEELCAFLEALLAEEKGEKVAAEGAPQTFLPDEPFRTMPSGAAKNSPGEASRRSREHQALLDLAGHAAAMARVMPALPQEEKERWERCAEHLMLAGANVPAMHRETADNEKRAVPGISKGHEGHKALATAAHHLISRVKEAGGHPKEIDRHLERALDHLEGLGAEPHQSGFTHGEKRAADGEPQAHGQLDRLLKAVAALNEKAAQGAERLSKLAAENEALRGRLERVEMEPLPPKTLSLPAGVSRVSKSADNADAFALAGAGRSALSDPELADRVALMSEEERAMLLIKASYRNPLRPQFAGPQTGRPVKE